MNFPDSRIPPYEQQDFSGNHIAPAYRRRRQNQQGERTSAKWDHQRTMVLLQIMTQLIADSHHRRGNTLCPRRYDKLVQDFNHKTGNTLSIGQIKSKVSILKRDWRAWMEVKNPKSTVTGMSWNYEKNTWDAPDSWWAWMQQVNSNVVKFRNRELEHVDLIEKVFHGTTAIGKMHWTSSTMPGTPKFGQFSGLQSRAEFVASSTTSPAHEMGIPIYGGAGASSGSGKKRRAEQDDMDEGYNARRRHQSQPIWVCISFNAPGYAVHDCVTKLLSMEGVNSHSGLYLFACQYFLQQTFMSQPA